MKAEERKELETNALADRMGHLMQRVRTQPRRSTLYWVIGGIILLVAAAFGIRYYQVSREEESQRWGYLDIGTQRAFQTLISQSADTSPGRAARFQLAWLRYWDFGVKRLGIDGNSALKSLDEAAAEYRKLAEECGGDPFWEPEALYGQAVVEETHALEDLKRLDSAKKLYEDVSTKYPESARGKLAKQWLEDYETPTGKKDLEQFYQEMRNSIRLVDPALLRKLLESHGKKGIPAAPKAK